jgi:hypothetical protein
LATLSDRTRKHEGLSREQRYQRQHSQVDAVGAMTDCSHAHASSLGSDVLVMLVVIAMTVQGRAVNAAFKPPYINQDGCPGLPNKSCAAAIHHSQGSLPALTEPATLTSATAGALYLESVASSGFASCGIDENLRGGEE